MMLVLTYIAQVYNDINSNVLLVCGDKIKFKDRFGESKVFQKNLENVKNVHKYNEIPGRDKLWGELWFSIYNRIAANQLSYLNFYIDLISYIISEYNYTTLKFNEKTPRNFCLPISFALGDISKEVYWNKNSFNFFIYKAFKNKIKIKTKFYTNYYNFFRKYAIFFFKILMSIFYCLIPFNGKIIGNVLVIRDGRTLENFDKKDYDSFLLIPSYRFFKDFVNIKKLKKCVLISSPFVAIKNIIKSNDALGEVHVNKELSVPIKHFINSYVLEEFDKYSIFEGLQKMNVNNAKSIFTPDFSSEYAYFQSIIFKNQKLVFVQTYALSTDRIKYLPRFDEIIVDDKLVIKSLLNYDYPESSITVKEIDFIPVKRIDKIKTIGLVSQPNFNMNMGLIELLEGFINYSIANNIKLLIKVHPRDTSNYREYSSFIYDRGVEDFIDDCDLLIGKTSYVLYESLKRGTMFLNLTDGPTSTLAYLNNNETTFTDLDELIYKVEGFQLNLDFFEKLQERTFK